MSKVYFTSFNRGMIHQLEEWLRKPSVIKNKRILDRMRLTVKVWIESIKADEASETAIKDIEHYIQLLRREEKEIASTVFHACLAAVDLQCPSCGSLEASLVEIWDEIMCQYCAKKSFP